MINLISTVSLLVNVLLYNSYTVFKYRLVNTSNEQTYCSVNQTTGSIVNGEGTLKVGEYYENSTYCHYYSVLEFRFPSFDDSVIDSASFTVNKSSGSASSINVYYTFDPLGFESVSWTYLTTSSLSGNWYSVDIYDLFYASIHYLNLNCIYFKLDVSGTSNVTLLGDSTVSSAPCFTIITHQTPASNTHGCASYYQQYDDFHFAYHENSNLLTNCYGYATNIRQCIYLTEATENLAPLNTDQDIEDKLIPYLINQMKSHYDINARLIDSYDSPIFPFERRIAFRKELSGIGFHFMRETSDGRWCSKNGAPSYSTVLDTGLTPDDEVWNDQFDSNTYYFAINNNGGSQFNYAF